MNRFTRRKFSGFLGTALAVSPLSVPDITGAAPRPIRPKVVIIGGGAGGASAAHYLANDANGLIEVTLIEPEKCYYSGFVSNYFLGGLRNHDIIGFDFRRFVSGTGINLVRDWAANVDRNRQTVKLASGTSIAYDRLIISPGIDIKFDSIEGYSIDAQTRMPHGLKSAKQIQIIKRQITNMPKGGTFVMVPSSDPHNSSIAPLERISMIAHYFTKHNPAAKIIVLDTADECPELNLFRDTWDRSYSGMIDWIPRETHGGIVRLNPETLEIETELGTFKADATLINPALKAGTIASLAELTLNDWVPIKPSSMMSLADSNIYVVGDASYASSMPKTAYSAVSQAKVAANAICGELIGADIPKTKFTSICWGRASKNNVVKLESSFRAGHTKIELIRQSVSQQEESANTDKVTFDEAQRWHRRFAADFFNSGSAIV